MIRDNDNWKLAEAYVAGSLSVQEQEDLQQKLNKDEEFAADFQECVNLILSMEGSGKQKRFRMMLRSIEGDKKPNWRIRTIPLRAHYFRTAGIAAGIAILTTLSTFWMVNHNEKKHSSQFQDLSKQVENIRQSQSRLIQNINAERNVPSAPVNTSGTGFAITNDGYLVTNYHVTKGADSIYIQNREGTYFKASLITFDEKMDVAVLRIENKDFRFGKSEVPYTFASGKSKLGSKVFTLGYPQDEIVYNEGYISSKNGFNGDSMQYRLELPANPGQSGAPVIDANGNIIGIVTGKETETERTTFAVSSKAIYQLLQSMPKKPGLHFPKTNKLSRLSREQQIDKLEYYTCSVKVYKK